MAFLDIDDINPTLGLKFRPFARVDAVRNVVEDVLAHVRIVSLFVAQASLFFISIFDAFDGNFSDYDVLFRPFQGHSNLSWILNNNLLLLVNAIESLASFLCCIEIDMDIFL
jgi:hypothetical protein